MEKKRIYISDIHMNAGRCLQVPAGKYSYEWLGKKEADRFTDFLKYANNPSDVKEIVIIGDLMDDWIYPVYDMPPTFQEIIDAPVNSGIVRELKSLSASSISVIYLPGNHDMGVTRGLVERNFPGMVFGGSALNNSVYRSGRLRAEHGSAFAMFNAPDPINNPSNRLPLGYFISRVVATREYEKGISSRHYWTYADDLLEMLGPQKLPQSVFEAILEEAGLPEDVEIKMRSNEGKEIAVTAGEVKQKYANLYEQWQQYYGPGMAFKAILAETARLGGIADSLCKKNDTNIVIFGHSHDWKLDKDSWFVEDRIYANCGTWCDDEKSCTFVETQKDYDNRVHMVRVMDWNEGNVKVLREKELPL
jgi:UDP-2,3-diacylglucosamine pyrophosphatase LpxH